MQRMLRLLCPEWTMGLLVAFDMIQFTISHQRQNEENESWLRDQEQAADEGSCKVDDILLCKLLVLSVFLGGGEMRQVMGMLPLRKHLDAVGFWNNVGG